MKEMPPTLAVCFVLLSVVSHSCRSFYSHPCSISTEKLHRLLQEVEAAGRSDVISFVASGRAFVIHKPDAFFKEIVPLYFRQSRLSSFKRQLNLYGFELINTGPARGGYYHELFVRDQPELCRRMRRVAVKVGSSAKKTGKTTTTAAEQQQQQKPVAEESDKQQQGIYPDQFAGFDPE